MREKDSRQSVTSGNTLALNFRGLTEKKRKYSREYVENA